MNVLHIVVGHGDSTSRGQVQHCSLDSHFIEAVAVPIEFGEPDRRVSDRREFGPCPPGGRTRTEYDGHFLFCRGKGQISVELLEGFEIDRILGVLPL